MSVNDSHLGLMVYKFKLLFFLFCIFNLIAWILLCIMRCLCSAKDFLQRSQQNGFSPAWTLAWFLRVDRCVNFLPQTSQPNGFSPVWVLMCVVSADLLTKSLPHSEQMMDLRLAPRTQTLLFRGFNLDSLGRVSLQLSPSSVSKSESDKGFCQSYTYMRFAASELPQSWSPSSCSLFIVTAVIRPHILSFFFRPGCFPSFWLVQIFSSVSVVCEPSRMSWSESSKLGTSCLIANSCWSSAETHRHTLWSTLA